jgi:serine/threonine protein kinase
MADSEYGLPGHGGPGQVLPVRLVAGRYRLVRELGRGGMGTVWLAEDQLVRRRVAVKELRPPQGLGHTHWDLYGQRALQEAHSAARIHHPGAITLYDLLPASADDDAVYLIMEYADGPTLAQLIGRHGPLSAAHVAAWGLQLLSVLETAHGLGIVHRDVKPSNIIIGGGGQARLTDFGIAHTIGDARLTRSGIMGTQAYMAPELFDSAPITAAADLWALGATLYHAAEGRGPFDRDTTGATLRAILIEDLPAPRCPSGLAAAITGLLQRDPAHRADIGQARAALQVAAQETPPSPALATGSLGIATTGPATTTTPGPATTTTPGPATTTTAPGTASAPGADGSPVASQPPPSWAQLPTTLSPAPPKAPPPPRPSPQPAPPRQSRRTALIATAAIAAVAVLAAITGGILVTSHHTSLQSKPPPKRPAIHPSLIATMSNPGSDGVKTLAFSPDGQTLATDDNGSVYLWSTASHSSTATLTDPGSKQVDAVAFSPDGKTLATADGNGNTYLWSTASHSSTATLADPGSKPVGSIAFSPDGKTLAAVVGGDTSNGLPYHGDVYLWNTTTRAVIATLRDPKTQGVSSVAFSPDGKTLAVADYNDSTYVWSTATHRITAALSDDSMVGGVLYSSIGVYWAAFSPDGRTLATADGNGNVYLWNVTTRSATAVLTDPNSNGVNSVAFSPGGKTLVTADAKGSTGYLWNIATRSVIATVSDPGGYEERVAAFSPDGRTLATGDDDGSAYLWQVPNGG